MRWRCTRKWIPNVAPQTMKLALCSVRTVSERCPSRSSHTPVAKTPTVASTSTGARTRIAGAGGPLRRYADEPA